MTDLAPTSNTNATVLLVTREHFERELRPAGWIETGRKARVMRPVPAERFPHGIFCGILGERYWEVNPKPATRRHK